MLSLKDAYGNDAVLKLFPKPDYSHISSDIVVGDAQWIDFDDIHIDDEFGNDTEKQQAEEFISAKNQLISDLNNFSYFEKFFN